MKFFSMLFLIYVILVTRTAALPIMERPGSKIILQLNLLTNFLTNLE